MKKKTRRETKNRHFTNQPPHFTNRRRSIFPAFVRFCEKSGGPRKIPFLAIFPISSGAFPPRTRSLAFHETPESTWKRVRMSETAERLFCAQTLVLGSG